MLSAIKTWDWECNPWWVSTAPCRGRDWLLVVSADSSRVPFLAILLSLLQWQTAGLKPWPQFSSSFTTPPSPFILSVPSVAFNSSVNILPNNNFIISTFKRQLGSHVLCKFFPECPGRINHAPLHVPLLLTFLYGNYLSASRELGDGRDCELFFSPSPDRAECYIDVELFSFEQKWGLSEAAPGDKDDEALCSFVSSRAVPLTLSCCICPH